jgi:EmrB/QacA subfamily drug resistance transporter
MAPPSARERWIAMSVLLVATFMSLMDVTIVNVALPSMKADFAATPAQIEWVVAIYILTFALCLLPGGRLGDIHGRRTLFMLGVAVFAVGSLLCGLAPGIETLVAARAVQAVGGAMMIPQTLSMVPAIFPPAERGAALALFGLSAGMAAVAGPILGGLLIGADLWGLGWRPIFLVNVPVALAAILLARRYLPRVGRRAGMGNDLVGIALAAVALLLVLFPLIEGRLLGWPWWCFAMMATSPFVALLFVLWQRRQAARDRPQLLPARLLTNRTYTFGLGLVALLFSGVPGFFLIMALFLQDGHGLTALQSGLTTVPFSGGILLASVVAGRLGNRVLRTRITAGALMLSGGMAVQIWLVSRTGDVFDGVGFIAPLMIAGFGLGTAISPLFNTVLATVEADDSGSAAGALQAFQQVGSALGVAIVGQIFFATLAGVAADGSSAAHAAYGAAFMGAVAYPVFGFAALAGLVWFLPAPRHA